MTQKVNAYYLASFLDPLIDVNGHDFGSIDSNDEAQVRRTIRDFIKPYFSRFDSDSQHIAKNTLGYYLTFGGIAFGDIFEFAQTVIEPPHDPRDFFVWLWEELFGDEPFEVSPRDHFVVDNDIHGPNSIKLAPE